MKYSDCVDCEVVLPTLTPPDIESWAKEVQQYHPLNVLAQLPENAPLTKIREAYDADRSTLEGIGEAIINICSVDLWPAPDENE